MAVPVSAKTLPKGIPNSLAPIADAQGQATQSWRYLMGTFVQKDDLSALQTQVTNLATQVAALQKKLGSS